MIARAAVARDAVSSPSSSPRLLEPVRGLPGSSVCRNGRIQAVTAGLRARIETDLRIGLDLAEDERLQPMLEDVVARTPILTSAEIDSGSGVVLF